MTTCNCWIKRAPAEMRFSLRYGAHAPSCPTYRPSLDPVDRHHDVETSEEGQRRYPPA